MSRPEKLIESIFSREIGRLHELSKKAPLDMADIVKFEKLIAAYSKYKPHEGDEEPDAELAHLSPEELATLAK